MNGVRKRIAHTVSGAALLGLALLSATAALSFVPAAEAKPVTAGETPAILADPFADLAGWWGGQGRLRFKDGKMEDVRCRATYFVEDEGNALRQNIRCASQSGKIELKSQVHHKDGVLSGEWREEMYNVSGTLDGGVTPNGFRVSVKSTVATSSLAANMDIIVKERRQLVEIQFFSETLVGLTLLLQKG